MSLMMAWSMASGAQAQLSSTSAATSCLVEPSLVVDVGTPVDGVLVRVEVSRGDVVKKGQLLAQLNSDVETAAVKYAEAKVEFGRRKLSRNVDLHRKQLISSQELDEIETELELAQLELREKREQWALRRMLSPTNGVVVEVYRDRGDLVNQEKIFRLAQLDPLHIETVVGAQHFGRVKIGQRAQVTLPLFELKLEAEVTSVDRVIDPASGTFRIRLALPNPNYAIPSGVRCNVVF